MLDPDCGGTFPTCRQHREDLVTGTLETCRHKAQSKEPRIWRMQLRKRRCSSSSLPCAAIHPRLGLRPMRERARPKMMHVQIPAHRQRKAGLPRLGAEDVAVEQAQVAPFVQCSPNLVEHHTLDQKTKAPQAVGFEPFFVVLLAEPLGEALHRG